MTNYGEANTSPIMYLKVFFRRKEMLLIPAFAGLILGLCAGILLPKEYKSSTMILVQEGKSDNPLFSNLAVSTTVEQRMTAIRETILGWNSVTELVKRLNLDKDVKTKGEFEGLVLKIRKNTIIKLRGSNLIDLSYVGKDPVQVQAVVQNITDIFIDRNVMAQNRETADAIKFIEEQLHVYKGKIKSAEIAQMQEQLDVLLIDSTENHPTVKELQERMQAKREELKKENLEYTENMKLSPVTANPIVNEIQKALTNLESGSVDKKVPVEGSDFYKVMLLDKLDNVMARDAGVNAHIYSTLLQRLETAKITQRLQSSKEGTSYTVLDPPRVPLKPFKPNKVLIALTGLFFGLMCGIGLVFASEFLDKSFIDVEEAKNYLGVALFGAISKINTVDSLRNEKEKKYWLYSLTVIAGVIVVILTTTISNFLK